MRVLPLFYLEHLTDEDIAEQECSDRIWLNRSDFENWVTSSDPGVVTLLEITNSVEQKVVGSPYSVHHNLEEPDVIYVPNWMYKLLELDDNVQISRFVPSLCTGLTIQPHTSDHLTFDDPELTLRNAFERYTCLTPGQEIPLWIGYTFNVTIASLKPTEGTLCIRNCELELELMPPLDAPAQGIVEAEAMPEPEPNTEATAIQEEAPGIKLGGITSTKSRRELAAEAALRRLAPKN